jgi:hypothetical protein
MAVACPDERDRSGCSPGRRSRFAVRSVIRLGGSAAVVRRMDFVDGTAQGR